jgi:hypothetical protein
MDRLPADPAASSTAHTPMAWPTQVVATGAWIYCIVSYTASMGPVPSGRHDLAERPDDLVDEPVLASLGGRYPI